MELELLKLASSLNLTPATVERWIRQGRLPVIQKGDHCIFSSSTLKKWAAENHLAFSPSGLESPREPEYTAGSLFEAMKRGGIFHNVDGGTVETVLRVAVTRIPGFETEVRQGLLLERLLAREALMSTGIGRGIAIPHPRTPLEDCGALPLIAVCFLKNAVDYKSVDRAPVFVLFVLVCPTPGIHLRMLARLSYCLRDDDFVDFLRNKPDSDVFYEKIREIDYRLDMGAD